MPKSKREKIISLTKTTKQTKEKKQTKFNQVIDSLEKFTDIYVFDYSNCRSKHIQDARLKFREDSQFFMTKNKLIKAALLGVEDKFENIEKIAEDLIGLRGMLYTNRPKVEVMAFFKNFRMKDFARTGSIAEESIQLQKGLLEDYPHSMLQRFQELNMPVELKNGKIYLTRDYVVCKEGDLLTPEQAKILKHLNYMISTFELKLKSHWSRVNGAVYERFLEDTEEEKAMKEKYQKNRYNNSLVSATTADDEDDDNDGQNDDNIDDEAVDIMENDD